MSCTEDGYGSSLHPNRSHMLAYKDLTRRRDTETRLCVKRTFRALNAYYASDPRAPLTGG